MFLGSVDASRKELTRWLARRRISGLLIITDPGPVATTPPLLAVSASKAVRKGSGTRSRVTIGVRAITLLLLFRTYWGYRCRLRLQAAPPELSSFRLTPPDPGRAWPAAPRPTAR